MCPSVRHLSESRRLARGPRSVREQNNNLRVGTYLNPKKETRERWRSKPVEEPEGEMEIPTHESALIQRS